MKKQDKLPDILKAVADQQAARDCMHPNVRFERYGAVIRCIDCKQRWFACMNDEFDLPDYLYGNPKMSENETRHSRFEPIRTEPKTTPKIKPATPAKGSKTK